MSTSKKIFVALASLICVVYSIEIVLMVVNQAAVSRLAVKAGLVALLLWYVINQVTKHKRSAVKEDGHP